MLGGVTAAALTFFTGFAVAPVSANGLFAVVHGTADVGPVVDGSANFSVATPVARPAGQTPDQPPPAIAIGRATMAGAVDSSAADAAPVVPATITASGSAQADIESQ